MSTLYIAGVGLVAPGLPSWDAAAPVLTGATPWSAADDALPSPVLLPKNERRRASATIRIALEAARQAVEASGLAARDLPGVFGCSSGDGEVVDTVVRTATSTEPRVSPTLFHNSVHNAPSGYWSIAAGAHVPSVSIGAFDATVAATLAAASVQARRQPVLACLYDAALPEPIYAFRPVSVFFGAALVLVPERPAKPLAQISVRIGAHALAPSPLQVPGLAPLLEGNPAGRILPLLEALARGQAREIVLPWQDSPPLAITVTPC